MSLFHVLVWPGGGFIGLLLWGLSLVTVAVIIDMFLLVRRSRIIPPDLPQAVSRLLLANRFDEAAAMTAERDEFLAGILHAALVQLPRGSEAMERRLAEAAEERTVRLLRRVEWLNLIGNVSPMLGLLGTVWGMINAFFTIVEVGGTPEPGALARAIGTFLVTTLLGLAIAIPALAVYGMMRNRVDAFSSEAVLAAEGILNQLAESKSVETLR